MTERKELLWNEALTEQLESAKASIKQLKKQWDEHELSIILCDQRRQNFQEVYSTKNFEQAGKIEALEKKLSIIEAVVKSNIDVLIGVPNIGVIMSIEKRVANLEKKMGIVDEHI